MKFFVRRDNALWAAHSKPAFIYEWMGMSILGSGNR